MEYAGLTFVLFTFTGNFVVTAGLQLPPDYDASCLQGSDTFRRTDQTLLHDLIRESDDTS